jgi:hypothetical protein
MANYSELRLDLFQVKKEEGEKMDFCFLCQYVDGCVVCPVNAAYSTESMGVVSCRTCELKKIQRDAQKLFMNNCNPCYLDRQFLMMRASPGDD